MPVHRLLNLGDGVCQTVVFRIYDGGFAVINGDFGAVRHGFLPDSEFIVRRAADKKQAAGRHIADVQTCSQHAQQRNDQQECNAFFHELLPLSRKLSLGICIIADKPYFDNSRFD